MIDIMMLKAAADACSPERLKRARAVAADPAAPRRALVGMPGDRAAHPHDYLDAIVTLPPQDAFGTSAVAEWFDARQRQPAVDGPEGRGAVAAALGLDPDESLSELLPYQRLAGYDAMSEELRAAWNAAFRRIAVDWLEAAAAEFTDATYLPRAAGWGQEAVGYSTVDGGQLLICAVVDHGGYDSVAAWFESALFVLAEIAEAAGFHEPVRFDVA
jgi:hypothetical protein